MDNIKSPHARAVLHNETVSFLTYPLLGIFAKIEAYKISPCDEGDRVQISGVFIFA